MIRSPKIEEGSTDVEVPPPVRPRADTAASGACQFRMLTGEFCCYPVFRSGNLGRNRHTTMRRNIDYSTPTGVVVVVVAVNVAEAMVMQ